MALHAAIEEMDKEYDEERRRLRDHSMSASDLDSFVSAKSVSVCWYGLAFSCVST